MRICWHILAATMMMIIVNIVSTCYAPCNMLSVLYAISLLTLHTPTPRPIRYHPHLIDEKTETQRNEVIFFFGLLRAVPMHMEVSRLGVESELWPPAYATATAMSDRGHICDLARVCGNSGSLTPWVRPGIEPEFSWILVRFLTWWAATGTPENKYFV